MLARAVAQSLWFATPRTAAPCLRPVAPPLCATANFVNMEAINANVSGGDFLRVEAMTTTHPARWDVVYIPCSMHELLLWRSTVDPCDSCVRRMTEWALAKHLGLGWSAAHRISVHSIVAPLKNDWGEDLVHTSYSLHSKVHW